MPGQNPIDELKFVNEDGRKYLLQLAQELAFGSVVLFAGAGLSFNAVGRDGGRNRMPSWGDLSQRLRDRMERDIRGDTDPLKVADYFETMFGRTALVEAVREEIKDSDHIPGRVHQAIARLNFEEIVTTNFDSLLERSFREQFVEPQVIVRGEDLVQRRRPPRIIKMNGCICLNPNEIVITGNDFLAYAETHPWVQVFVTKSFVESTVLFVGFGLNDPAFRSINERVLSMLGPTAPRLAFSLQHGASQTEMEFWKNRQVQIIDLRSGEPDDSLDNEERLHRVLEAFGKVQKERVQSLRPKPRSPLYQDASLYRDTGLAETHRTIVREMLAAIGPHLKEAEHEDIACCRAESFPGLAVLLSECIRRFAKGTREKRDPKCDEALGELATWLKEICRLDDMEKPGVELEAKDWLALRSLADLLLGSELAWTSFRTKDLVSNLRVLAALLSLKLLILTPRLAREWYPEDQRRAAEERLRAAGRLRHALHLLDIECLRTQDMQIRSRLILLLCFFGPQEHILKLADVWTNGRNERDLAKGGKSWQETPVEYRLLPLSFYGVLLERQGFFKAAAESLWSRHAFKDDPNAGWRIENTFRYRNLRQATPDEEWAGVRLHTDRLARVLGQVSLQHKGAVDSAGDKAIEELLALLLELNRGWLFGCPPPEALFRAWDAAEAQHAKKETAEVPWEALILLSLPILGTRLFERWQRLLHEVWTAGHLDTGFLADHIVRRLGKKGFGRLLDHRSVEDSPVGRYEAGIAHMVEWLAERATFESQDSPLNRKLGAELLPELKIWLCGTPYPEVRRSLIRSLASLRKSVPQEVCQVVQMWAESQLARHDQSSSLELAVLDPPPGKLSIERYQIQLLLAHAQAPKAAGTGFRNDLLKWLVSWAEHGELDSLTLTTLADPIVDFITEKRSSGGSVDWLTLAARIRVCPRLREEIEKRLSQRSSFSSAPRLYELVKGKLWEMPEPNRRQLRDKGVLLASLIPFAEDFDTEIAEFVAGSLDSPKISSGSRNDAVDLLATLLASSPEGLREQYAARWTAALHRFLLEGATGRGLRREQIRALDPEALRALQANLIIALERERDIRSKEIVAEIAGKIRLGDSIPLAELEEELVRGIQSPHEALAFHCLEAVIGLCRELPDFPSRNLARIRRVRGLVEELGNYRKPSRFAELLADLQDLERAEGTPPVETLQGSEIACLLPAAPINGGRRKAKKTLAAPAS